MEKQEQACGVKLLKGDRNANHNNNSNLYSLCSGVHGNTPGIYLPGILRGRS